MSLITKMRRQKGVYWAPLGTDTFGKTTYAPAVEISCRWDDVAEAYIDRLGATKISLAKVYPSVPVELAGVLWLGTLDSVVHLLEPFKNSGAYEIRRVDNIPNLRATETLRIATL